MSKAISPYFTRLGAPLANVRWAWGSQREDGVIFLRVWQDEIRRHEGKLCCRITNHARDEHDPAARGYQQRLEQITAIENGSPCYLIICEAADPAAEPRTIKDFNADEVFEAGPLHTIDGDQWIEMGKRHPYRNLLSKSSSANA